MLRVPPSWTRIATGHVLRDQYFLVIDDWYCFPIVWKGGAWTAATCLVPGSFDA
jgi:hypothetical protein